MSKAARDRKSKAAASFGSLRPLETLENPLLVFRRDAWTLVRDMGAGKAVRSIEGDRDRASLRRMPDGIPEEIDEDLNYAARIAMR